MKLERCALQCNCTSMNLIKRDDPNVGLSVVFFPFPPGFDTLLAEFPSLPEQQDQLQLGVRDPAVPGLHLWEHNWRAGTAWSVHQREKRRADQPDAGKFDRVLPGALPRKSGKASIAAQSVAPPLYAWRALCWAGLSVLRTGGVLQRCSLYLPYKGGLVWVFFFLYKLIIINFSF